MAVYNYENEEINIKIVYYGPALSGKTTNLEHMHSKLPKENKGKMVSMKTRTDRTLFFDFLPIEVDGINGMKLRFLLYTVPGQVYYNATRKLVLKGIDAVVFIADSSPDRMQENIESFENLEENLGELGMSLKEVPHVVQLNKRDLVNRMSREDITMKLDCGDVPVFEAIAMTGKGVYETFEGVAALVYEKIQKDLKRRDRQEENIEKPAEKHIDAEVVAKGKQRIQNSEAGESESLNNAEEREEEHESVSEFVDNVLNENGSVEEGIQLNATREGYEDYGHLVELNDEDEKHEEAVSEMDIIVDPQVKEPLETGEKSDVVENEVESTEQETGEEKTIHVPVMVTKADIGKEVPVKVILKITVGNE